MIITFANQKGGVGKSTLAIALANYLAIEHNKKVNAFDCDIQKSFFKIWEEDNKSSSAPQLYEVELLTGENETFLSNDEFLHSLEQMEDICIFDTAGAISNKYSLLFYYSDFIIVPFEYSSVNMMSAVRFMALFKAMREELKIDIDAQFLFVKSNMRKDEKYPLQDIMDNEFKRYGKVIGETVYKRKSLLQINSRQLTYEQKLAVKPCFEEIIYNLWD